MNRIFVILIFLSGLGCSLDVKKANVETAPPQAQPTQFKSSQIIGNLTSDGAPTMFLWPVNSLNEETGVLTPLSLAEQAKLRGAISGFSDDVDTYTEKYEGAQAKLDKKYLDLAADFLREWKSNRCYAYCDPEDIIFCEPDNAEVTSIDQWKVPTDPEEEHFIQACQKNQAQREELEPKKKEEVDLLVTPAKDKAGAASLAVLNAIGDRNLFLESDKSDLPVLDNFSLKTGPFSCALVSNGCFPWQEFAVYIRMSFNGQRVSNYEGEDKRFQIRDVNYDQENGYLSFKAPFRDNDSDEFRGYIAFDLEVKEVRGMTRLDGDIRMTFKGQERVGRFSLTGEVSPIEGL